jgi:hypothetical protein
MDGWMDGWMGGWKNRQCKLQRSCTASVIIWLSFAGNSLGYRLVGSTGSLNSEWNDRKGREMEPST